MNRRILRWRYIVDWRLQGSLCAHGLLYGLLVLVAVCAGIFLPLLWNLRDVDRAVVLEEQAVVMVYMHERFWWLALWCFLIVVLGSIKFSHRIAGPLVRYKRNLRLMADGKLPAPLRTRAGDYLQEEVACLNRAVAGIAARVEAMQAAQAVLDRALHDALDRLPQAAASELEPVLAANRELERRLAAIERFDPRDDVLPEPVTAPVAALALAGPTGEGG
ncbi:MAG: hypothetical protein KF830_02615 [Planctomycetes bacterium]|nr:hypothetical protein [Planctomycetota bacterium]